MPTVAVAVAGETVTATYTLPSVVVPPPVSPPVTVPSVIPAGGTVILKEDFTTFTTRPGTNVSAAEFDAKLGMTRSLKQSTGTLEDVLIQRDSDGTSWLRFRLDPQYLDKGTTIWTDLPDTVNGKPIDEAWFEYDIRFDGFDPDWGWGGKLPGLSGVSPGTDVALPAGGHYPGDKGWSGRVMWIGADATGKSSYTTKLAGRKNWAMVYAYGKDQTEHVEGKSYGENRWFTAPPAGKGSFTGGKRHRLTMHYKLNTPALANGVLEAFLDGVRVLRLIDWRPRGAANVHVGNVMWHVFRGGNTAAWGVNRECHVDITNVSITAF